MDTTGYTPEEPIAAIATALAPAALGIVRTSGKGSIQLVSKLFSRPEKLLKASGYTIVYGWMQNPKSSGTVQKIDQVLLSVFRAPKSFTGEDMVEISCHGGPSVVNSLFNLLLKNGFRQAQRGEFTFRAYINGKTDLTRAEAVKEIIDSKTDASRSRAAGRLSGDVYRQIEEIKQKITGIIGTIEVEIEYPEDEETISETFDREPLRKAQMELEDLSASWKSEKLYQDGARVVLCGKTNAGKSSLFNVLLKEDRAIVSAVEGTTRDWIESWVDFDGIPARLFDTAGLRETNDVIEKDGVERTRDLSNDADLIVYLADAVKPLDKDDVNFLQGRHEPVLLVWNKCDKIVHEDKRSLFQVPAGIADPADCVKISAKKGTGISDFVNAVKNQLVKGAQTDRDCSGLGSERQKTMVDEAFTSVRHALSVADREYSLDAVVQDLEDALDYLGYVTGAITPDDILGSIFSQFCVGK